MSTSGYRVIRTINNDLNCKDKNCYNRLFSNKWKCWLLNNADNVFTPLTNDIFIDLVDGETGTGEINSEKLELCCNKLFGAIPVNCCDKRTRKFLRNQVVPKCSLITVEYPYYESDYLSTFYLYHVRKFQPIGKACCRLILYDIKGEYVGYISLRPIAAERKISRTYLSPEVFAPSNYKELPANLQTRSFFVIWGKYKIHVGGDEGAVQAMPYMQQEGDVAVCAHVALWSVLRFFSSRFHNSRDYTMGEIVSLVPSPQVRKIPSRGLTVEQISTVLTEAGFSTIIIRRNARYQNDFFSEAITYLDSGIPVIAFSRELSHAVVLCGRIETNKDIFYDSDTTDKESLETRLSLLAENPESESEPKADRILLFDSSLVDCVLVNDDNKSPYFAISRLPNADGNQSDLTSFSQIDFCIVPLYKRMQLSYSDAKNIVSLLCNDTKYLWDDGSGDEGLKDYLIVKMNIASSNTIKEYIKDNVVKGNIPVELNNLLNIPYSRFLWIAEISTISAYHNRCCTGIILLDSTCSVTDTNVCLALADQQKCEFVLSEPVPASYEIEYNKDTSTRFCLPLFDKNFKKIVR